MWGVASVLYHYVHIHLRTHDCNRMLVKYVDSNDGILYKCPQINRIAGFNRSECPAN